MLSCLPSSFFFFFNLMPVIKNLKKGQADKFAHYVTAVSLWSGLHDWALSCHCTIKWLTHGLSPWKGWHDVVLLCRHDVVLLCHHEVVYMMWCCSVTMRWFTWCGAVLSPWDGVHDVLLFCHHERVYMMQCCSVTMKWLTWSGALSHYKIGYLKRD